MLKWLYKPCFYFLYHLSIVSDLTIVFSSRWEDIQMTSWGRSEPRIWRGTLRRPSGRLQTIQQLVELDLPKLWGEQPWRHQRLLRRQRGNGKKKHPRSFSPVMRKQNRGESLHDDPGMDCEPPEVEDGPTKAILFTPPAKKRSTMTIRGSKIHQVFELNEPVMVEQRTLEDLAQQHDLYQYATLSYCLNYFQIRTNLAYPNFSERKNKCKASFKFQGMCFKKINIISYRHK